MQLHHFRGMHSFEPVCSVVPMNTEMHTYAFNALMANNYVLIHLHFFVQFVRFFFFFFFFGFFLQSSFFPWVFFLCVHSAPLSCVMKHWANKCTCTYAMNAFSLREHLMLMHTTNIKEENGLTRDLCVVCCAVLCCVSVSVLFCFSFIRSFFLSFRCLV